MLEKIKSINRKTLFLALSILFLYIVFLYMIFGRHVLVKDEWKLMEHAQNSEFQVVPLEEGKSVCGIFEAPSSRLRGIGAYVVAVPEEGNLVVTIEDGKGKVLREYEAPLSELKEVDWYELTNPVYLVQGRNYVIRFAASGYGESEPPMILVGNSDESDLPTFVTSEGVEGWLYVDYRFYLPFTIGMNILVVLIVSILLLACGYRLINNKGMVLPSKIELTFISFVQKYFYEIAIFVLFLLSFVLRYLMKDMLSGDMDGYLLGWYAEIRDKGGMSGIYEQVGNYGLAYQLAISLFTYLPIEPIYVYKIFSVVFDYALAAEVMSLVYYLYKDRENARRASLLAGVIVLLTPTVMLNSAAWGQCDAIYTFFVIVTLKNVIREKFGKAYIFYGLALVWKLQAIFFLPFLVFYWLYTKKHSIICFLYSVSVFFLCGIPNIIVGRGFDSALKIYVGQSTDAEYDVLSLSYPAIYRILQNADEKYPVYDFMLTAALIFAVVLMGILFIYLWHIKAIKTNDDLVYVAFLITYLMPMILPEMHGRYAYAAEIISTILVFRNRRTLPLWVIVQLMTLCHYSSELFGLQYNMHVLSYLNIMVYFGYLFVFTREQKKVMQ